MNLTKTHAASQTKITIRSVMPSQLEEQQELLSCIVQYFPLYILRILASLSRKYTVDKDSLDFPHPGEKCTYGFNIMASTHVFHFTVHFKYLLSNTKF
ncbi:hypothetical protein GFK82_00678 [Candidatus Steffania adelgidicola]|nr:hypothetical protein GFK82_00678 [Candidatus Steffania adelgidicola]